MKNLFFYGLIVLLLIAGCKQSREGVFTLTTEQVPANKYVGAEVMNQINLKIDLQKLRSDSSNVLILPIAEGRSIRLLKKREDKFSEGRSAWFGIVEGDPGSFVLLSITKEAIAGKITTSKGEIYSIRYLGKGIHRLAQIDGTKFKETADDAVRIAIPKGGIETAADCPDPATQIDVMVVYTADAQTEAGDAAGMEAFIYECIYLSNLSYQNSNINQRVNLVHFEQVTYTESANSNTDLTHLQNATDGVMDNVQTLRNKYGADVVVLLTHTLESGICGLGYLPNPPSSASSEYGYSVVKMSCAFDNLSFPHEMGHNMGADHSCGTTAAINHGYFLSHPADGGDSWRTVMSYQNCTAGSCIRIPYFSNPGIGYSPTGSSTTNPLGTAAAAGTCTSDNHTVLNNSASAVANYRCGSPGVNNVWMRDTWQDTGLEPDPATAGQAMYLSPYIWIRNTQDPTFLHQYEHQNPEFGQPNWVYVKMHNGGAAATGHLEVYFANASVSLTWPASWTLLSSVTVNIPASNSKVVEIPWNTLPGTGHYCMIARWVSATDPMTFAETADINYNTKQNNNIVWHNLNIVDLVTPDSEAEEEFRVESLGKVPFSIDVQDEALFPKHAFTESGKILVKLDASLYEAWKRGGAKGTGIKVNGEEIEVTASPASLDNISLQDEKKPHTVHIRFVKSKKTIADEYTFTVQQTITTDTRQIGKNRKVIGGVSYKINATNK